MGAWRYSSTDTSLRHWIGTSGQLHFPAAYPGGKRPCQTLNRRLDKPQERSGSIRKTETYWSCMKQKHDLCYHRCAYITILHLRATALPTQGHNFLPEAFCGLLHWQSVNSPNHSLQLYVVIGKREGRVTIRPAGKRLAVLERTPQIPVIQ